MWGAEGQTRRSMKLVATGDAGNEHCCLPDMFQGHKLRRDESNNCR